MIKFFNTGDIADVRGRTYLGNELSHAVETTGYNSGSPGGPGVYTELTGTVDHWSLGALENPVVLLSGTAGYTLQLMYGISENSTFQPDVAVLGVTATARQKRMHAVYRQMSALWQTGDEPWSIGGDALGSLNEAIFLTFAPATVADRLRRGSTKMYWHTASSNGWHTTGVDPGGFAQILTASDSSWAERMTLRRGNDFSELFTGANFINGGGSYVSIASQHNNAAVIAIDPTRLIDTGGAVATEFWFSGSQGSGNASVTLSEALTGSSPGVILGGFLQHLVRMDWQGERDTHAVTFYCNAGPGEFNYSSNPTFTSGTSGKVWTLSGSFQPSTYVSTVGLYNTAQDLLAVVRLSRPLQKQPGVAFTIPAPLTF